MDRLSRIFRSCILLKGLTFLQEQGFKTLHTRLQNKLCAYEAGLGVYGRNGLLIHPELGCRIGPGIILTDAVLEPDRKLEDFNPCQDCRLCIEKCPAQAFEESKEYPDSWSRDKCLKMRGKIADRGLYCHNCLAACPAGKFKDEQLLVIKTAASYFKKNETQHSTV